MATPSEHRRDLEELTDQAERDLRLVIAAAATADETRDALMDVLPQLFIIYGSASATLAADWYDDLRDASGTRGRFRAIPLDPPDVVRAESLARWAVSPLYDGDPDVEAFEGRLLGGTQRVIADTGRNSVIQSIREDPQAGGWSRHVTTGCTFCGMLAGRGAVYSAETADFSSHDNCKCVAVPKFGAVKDVKPYVPSQRFRTPEDRDANNANVREYLKSGKPGKRSVRTNATEQKPQVDRDASRTTDQLRETLGSLENSLAKFESPGTRARVEELRRKIAARDD